MALCGVRARRRILRRWEILWFLISFIFFSFFFPLFLFLFLFSPGACSPVSDKRLVIACFEWNARVPRRFCCLEKSWKVCLCRSYDEGSIDRGRQNHVVITFSIGWSLRQIHIMKKEYSVSYLLKISYLLSAKICNLVREKKKAIPLS